MKYIYLIAMVLWLVFGIFTMFKSPNLTYSILWLVTICLMAQIVLLLNKPKEGDSL